MPNRTPGHALDVVLLADHTPPTIGGRESLLREIALRQPADRTRLITSQSGNARTFDGASAVPIHRGPYVPWLGARASRWLRHRHLHTLLRRRPGAMFVAFGITGEGNIALEAKRTTGAPYVLHLEAPQLSVARRELRQGGDRARMIQEILDESESILVASRACRLEAYKAGVLPQRIEVIPPGVDLGRFRPGPKPDALVQRHELGRGPVLLAIAGRGPAKDADTVFRAFAAVHAQKNTATLLVVGPDEATWRSRAWAAKAQAGVRFVGTVTEEALPDYFRVADLMMVAHREDPEHSVVSGVEIALVEALASGVPVVGTRVGSTEEIAPPEDVGMLVEAEAHAKLARAALDVLDPERLAEMKLASRVRAEAEFSADARSARFREMLEVIYFRRLSHGRLAHEEEPQSVAPAA